MTNLLVCQKISLFLESRDLMSVIRTEIQRFDEPLSKTMIQYLGKKYGYTHFFVSDLSCDGKSDCHLFAGLDDPHQIHIFSLAVRLEFEDKGWGKKLLLHFENSLDEQVTSIYLEVREDNFRAIQLYETVGFQQQGKKLKYYNDSVDALIMVKQI